MILVAVRGVYMRHESLIKEKKKQDKETYMRLTATQHIVGNHFSQHKRIEGFFENRNAPGFIGSDRLFRLDTMYGTIQMGYSPQRRKSFIFANIKTSVFDTAASRFQKEVRENQMARHLRSGSQNTIFSARRLGASAITLFKGETQPWSPRSVAPYLRRSSLETLKKTMPFLERKQDYAEKRSIKAQFKELQSDVRIGLLSKDYTKMAEARTQQVELTARENMLDAIIYRKSQQSLLFFRKINVAFESQKNEMYTYYQERRRGATSIREALPPDSKPDTEE